MYGGSFDGFTDGHRWVAKQGEILFDRFAIVVAINPAKNYTFTINERLAMAKEVCGNDVEYLTIENKYLVNFASDMGATHLLRGVRSEADYLSELAMMRINTDINPNINTIFVFPPIEIAKISSSVVKSLIGPEGWEDIVKKYVPEIVFQRLLQKYNEGKGKNEGQ